MRFPRKVPLFPLKIPSTCHSFIGSLAHAGHMQPPADPVFFKNASTSRVLVRVFVRYSSTFPKYLCEPDTYAVPFPNQPHKRKTSLSQGSVDPLALHTIARSLILLDSLLQWSGMPIMQPAPYLRRKACSCVRILLIA